MAADSSANMQTFNKKSGGLLSGLGSGRDVSAFAKGQAMQGQAALGMDMAQKRQSANVDQSQEDSQQRLRTAQNLASRAGNESQERMANAQLGNRQSVFNIGMGFDYGALQRRNQLNLQQSLLNGLARSF